MDFNSAAQEIKSRWHDLYPADGNGRGKGIICPICGSGSGANGTGISCMKGSGNYFLKCWNGGCDFNKGGSVIDLYMMEHGIEYPAAVRALADELGLVIENSTAAADFAPAGMNHSFSGYQQQQQRASNDAGTPTADYTGYYRSCADRLQSSPQAISYLQGRGISLETVQPFLIGFDPAADPASAPGAADGEYKPHPCPRIIIPTATGHYVGRSIDPNTEKRYAKLNPNRAKGASEPGIFNRRAIWQAETVFVVEGAFDALSLLEVGAAAIALNSTSNAELLLKEVQQQPTKATFVLCLDNDPAGKKTQTMLKDGLRKLNISYCTADICGGHKDPNEALQADRAAFAAAVSKAQGKQAAKPDNTTAYIDELMAGEIDRYKEAGNRKTGFSNLDAKAGGLYSGLYVMAAISSLGKTTIALQMADQIAAAGQDVLFFSMEQSRLELVSKSLARMTAQENLTTASSSLAIRKGNLTDTVLKAADRYKAAVADRISIVEGNFNCDIGYIGEYVRDYMHRTGTKPVVFIDYLQILQPAAEGKEHNSKKDEIDKAVTELKRMSRELDLTVIVISSVNRANYMTEFSFESLKESGGIEYTADVVWGLQLACLDEELFTQDKKIKEKRKRIAEAKAETPRKIKFVCIKNRYGVSYYDCSFLYYPQYDLFLPDNGAEFMQTQQHKAGRGGAR